MSVVIPTHRRETRLAFALESLARQTLPPDRFEVIVVRSRATEEPFAVAPPGLRVRFIQYEGEPNRSAHRNAGWRAASGELVAFMDDDCRATERWLAELVAAPGETMLQGRTVPDPDEEHLLHGLAHSIRIEGPSPWFETCNLALPRGLLEELGGFDEAYIATGEDTDLGLRAQAGGARLEYVERALVYHAVVPRSPLAAARSGWAGWHTTPLLFRRHPPLRRHLVAGFFLNRSHLLAVILLAGLPFIRRRPAVSVLAAAPFALDGYHLRDAGARSLLRHLAYAPLRLVAVLAKAAGLLRGAVRHRSPMV